MHADLMPLYGELSALSLDHDFHKEVKAEQNCCQFYYHLLVGVILV